MYYYCNKQNIPLFLLNDIRLGYDFTLDVFIGADYYLDKY